MAFAPSVREEALVKSGRRCCVCHEFAGRSTNVHHIIQEADGGTNTIDNGIVLCLRCHAEAGHFNSRHPLGTKYSPTELRKHRDNWWRIVESGRVPPPYEVRVTWKRIRGSQELHTQRLLVHFQNGEESAVENWKLHLFLPSTVPVRMQNIDKLNDIRIDGIRYTTYEITGGQVFPGEHRELIGMGLTWAEYDMNDDLYDDDKSGRRQLMWRFYSSNGAPLEDSIPWDQMHEF
jgi:hypothetical protein